MKYIVQNYYQQKYCGEKKRRLVMGSAVKKRRGIKLARNDIIKTSLSRSYEHNNPQTCEQEYYRNIFDKYYKGCDKLIPYFWMPKFIEGVSDAARTLDV